MPIGYIAGDHADRAMFRKLGQIDEILAFMPDSADTGRAPDDLARCETIVIDAPGDLTPGAARALGAMCMPRTLVLVSGGGLPDRLSDLAKVLAAGGAAVVDFQMPQNLGDAGSRPILISGASPDCERAAALLAKIGLPVLAVGLRVGAARALHLVEAMLDAGNRLATLEVVALGRKMGLPLATMTDLLNKGSGRNGTTQTLLCDLVAGTATVGQWSIGKDVAELDAAIELAMDLSVPTPMTNIARGLFAIGNNVAGAWTAAGNVTALVGALSGTAIGGAAEAWPKPGDSARSPDRPRIGYIGLGRMGGALARRLMLSHNLMVFDTDPALVGQFEAEGARAAADLATLGRNCDMVFLCVPNSAIAREVILGANGLAAALAPGTIIIDQTTGDPVIARSVAAILEPAGVAIIDAPVAGGPRGAVAGTIAMMCGGEPAAFAAASPVLATISPNAVYCGPSGNGHLGKLVNAALASSNRLLTYEAAALGVKAGLSLAHMDAVINSGTASSGASERILPALSTGKATADFQLDLMVKDLKLVGRTALECGVPLFMSSMVRSLYQDGVHILGGTANLDDMARLFATRAALEFIGA